MDISSRVVLTTSPAVPPFEQFPIIQTSNARVVLRPYRPEDLHALYKLRSQIEVMKWTTAGVVDADLDATRTWITNRLSGLSARAGTVEADSEPAVSREPTFNFIIAYSDKHGDDSAEVIGVIGCHKVIPKPEVGYLIREEFWGLGIATAALRAFVKTWWSLSRTNVKLHTRQEDGAEEMVSSVPTDEVASLPVEIETLKAVIEASNIGSQRVLEKCGFKLVSRETVSENDKTVNLATFVHARPESI